MSRYDPQRRRRLTTRANTSAVEALLDGEPSRPRPRPRPEDPAVAGVAPSTAPLAARSGCLSALLGMGRR